jgi:hypothetical protein
MLPADFLEEKKRLVADTVRCGHRDLVARWIAVLLWESLDDPFAMVDAVTRRGINLHDADGDAGTRTTRFPADPLVYP